MIHIRGLKASRTETPETRKRTDPLILNDPLLQYVQKVWIHLDTRIDLLVVVSTRKLGS